MHVENGKETSMKKAQMVATSLKLTSLLKGEVVLYVVFSHLENSACVYF